MLTLPSVSERLSSSRLPPGLSPYDQCWQQPCANTVPTSSSHSAKVCVAILRGKKASYCTYKHVTDFLFSLVKPQIVIALSLNWHCSDLHYLAHWIFYLLCIRQAGLSDLFLLCCPLWSLLHTKVYISLRCFPSSLPNTSLQGVTKWD